MIQQTKINDRKRYNIKNDKLNDTTPQKTTLQFCKAVFLNQINLFNQLNQLF